MNCDKCCGCVPPITTYNPSVADNFPTILQQVEYLKAMLKKYPSQQWFVTQEKVTEEMIKLDSTKVSLRGRAIAEGDFILGNTECGTTLMFQYTGATIELTNYVVEFVGVYSDQSEAQEALQRANGANELARQALSLAQTNEKDIGTLDGQVAELETKANVLPDNAPELAVVLCSNPNNKMYYTPYREYGAGAIPVFNAKGRLRSAAGGNSDEVATMIDLEKALSGEQHFEQIYTNGLHINSSVPIYYNNKLMLVPSTQMSPILLENGLKTIFGNQSLVGSGNIDLYKHHIKYHVEGDTFTANVYIDFYSSKNTVVDSLTDLKTLLGDTFQVNVYGNCFNGNVNYAPLYMDETSLYYLSGTALAISMLTGTFADTVTTI